MDRFQLSALAVIALALPFAALDPVTLAVWLVAALAVLGALVSHLVVRRRVLRGD
jgi:hypothetical protein